MHRDTPQPEPSRAAKPADRPERLAQALRANLARRKAQQRARAEATAAPPRDAE